MPSTGVLTFVKHFNVYGLFLFSQPFGQVLFGTNSLFGQTLVKLLNFLLGPSVYFFVKSSFRKNRAVSLARVFPPQYLVIHNVWSGSSRSTIPKVMPDHSGLPSAKNPVRLAYPESPSPLMYSLSSFLFTDPPSLLLCYEFPLAHAIVGNWAQLYT